MALSPKTERYHFPLSLSQHSESQGAWQFLRNQLNGLKPSFRSRQSKENFI